MEYAVVNEFFTALYYAQVYSLTLLNKPSKAFEQGTTTSASVV